MRKLYTFLGTTRYDACIYQCAGWESSKTNFVQVAIIEMLSQRGKKPDEVVVFLTRTARETNWEDGVSSSGEPESGLYRTLISRFGENAFRIKTVEIQEHQNEEALWDFFEKLEQETEENSQIYLDITHSFRSIPAISLIISNYMRVLKKTKLGGLFYGTYIHGQEKNPLYDLTKMLALFEWSQAVDDYLRTGSAKLLMEVMSVHPIENREDDQLLQLARRLKEVSMVIETCRGQMVDDAIRNAILQLRLLQEGASPHFKPFQKLLSKIERKFEGYRPGDLENNIIFIVQWCLDHQLYQQGYTFLQEGILEILANHAGLELNRKNRGLIQAVIYEIIGRNKDSSRTSNHVDQSLIERWRPLAPNLKFYPELADYRNSINHAQTMNNTYNHEQVVLKLGEFLEYTKRFIFKLSCVLVHC